MYCKKYIYHIDNRVLNTFSDFTVLAHSTSGFMFLSLKHLFGVEIENIEIFLHYNVVHTHLIEETWDCDLDSL